MSLDDEAVKCCVTQLISESSSLEISDEKEKLEHAQMMSRLQKWLASLTIDTERISQDYLQYSLVVVPGILSQPWLDPSRYPLTHILQSSFPSILNEFQKLCSDSPIDVLAGNDSPNPDVFHPYKMDHVAVKGIWKSFKFYSRGKRIDNNCEKCPITSKILDSIQNLGEEAIFSVLAPNSHIKPHTGLWNTRYTFHLGIKIPSNCSIRVGKEERSWKEGEVLVFDDSYEHESWNKSSEWRVVLMINVWHPDLNPMEQKMLRRFCEIQKEQETQGGLFLES